MTVLVRMLGRLLQTLIPVGLALVHLWAFPATTTIELNPPLAPVSGVVAQGFNLAESAKHGLPSGQTARYDDGDTYPYQWAVSAAVLLLLAALSVLWRWNLRLKKEVAKRKRAEETLLRNQSMMERTQHIAQLGSWEWDVATDTIVWSPELYRIVQRNPACGTPDYAGQLKLYAPEDGAQLGAAVETALRQGTPYDLELRMNRGDGETRICRANGYAEIGAKGEVQRLFGYLQDITDRKRAEASVEQYLKVVQASLDGFMITEISGSILDVNASACRILGYTREEMLALHVGDIEADKSPDDVAAHMREMMDSGHSQFQARHRRKDGRIIHVEVSVMHLSGMDDRFFGFFKDVTARKESEEQLRIAAIAFEAQEGMLIADANGIILRVNQAFTLITGYSSEDAVGNSPRLLRSGRHGYDFYTRLWDSLRQLGTWQGEIWNRRKSGESYPQWLTITAVKDKGGTVTHYVATMTDITQRKLAESEINALAFYDPLTGLPNRRLMLDRLRQAVTSGDRHQRHGALMMMDLDNFKTLNDTQGHDVGDQLLIEVASRLQAGVREGDTVARLGGDEFVVILEGLDRAGFSALQAEAVGVKIQALINKPYELVLHSRGSQSGKCIHHCSVSIGITLFHDQQVSTEELMKRADTAMYQAKTAGRNTLRFFDPEMQAAVTTRAAMEIELRSAITHNQFALYYQAQVDGIGQVVGAEALVRWLHPERGVVFPAEFISLAEDTGLILPLGHWVMQAACHQLSAWALDPETAQLSLAVNVSARQFRQKDFVEAVLLLVDQSGVQPGRLKLELTESMLLDNTTDIIAKMGALKARGSSFSLDDFGTGYSSLSYLKQLPIDQLKIDRSFVRDVLTDPNDAAIARTIVALALSLDLAVIAEGVENEGQRHFLAQSGCDLCQGYLFSRPVPVKEFESQLKPR